MNFPLVLEKRRINRTGGASRGTVVVLETRREVENGKRWGRSRRVICLKRYYGGTSARRAAAAADADYGGALTLGRRARTPASARRRSGLGGKARRARARELRRGEKREQPTCV